jgi:hypothetical protein
VLGAAFSICMCRVEVLVVTYAKGGEGDRHKCIMAEGVLGCEKWKSTSFARIDEQ